MDIFFSLVLIAAKVVFKETFTALVKFTMSRIKERIAPICSRDDSAGLK